MCPARSQLTAREREFDGGILTAKHTTTGPDAAQGGHEAVATVGSHGGLDDLEGLAQSGDLEHIEAGSEEQVGELDGFLLQLFLRARSRNGGDGGHDDGGSVDGEGALTKGLGCFFAGFKRSALGCDRNGLAGDDDDDLTMALRTR